MDLDINVSIKYSIGNTKTTCNKSSVDFVVNFEQVSHIILVLLLLT